MISGPRRNGLICFGVVLFLSYFRLCLVAAKLLYWLFETAGLYPPLCDFKGNAPVFHRKELAWNRYLLMPAARKLSRSILIRNHLIQGLPESGTFSGLSVWRRTDQNRQPLAAINAEKS